MRLHGKKIEGLNVVTIVIPRGNGENIILKAQAITYEEFDAVCPRPKGKTIVKARTGERLEDTKAKSYQDAMSHWAEMRVAFMILKSLEATPDLEWETVDIKDVNSWRNYIDELKKAGFSDAEQANIVNAVMEANGLSQVKIDEARASFLAGQQVESNELLSSTEEQPNMESSELVKDSA